MRRSRRPAQQPPDTGAGGLRPRTNAPSAPPAGAPATTPSDGDHNQGGTRPEGLDYQRDLGVDQDA
ncbi:hypothetical protein [Burkholderia ubonensis]|uniref:hypothetical protein n=1 Tax=Burkholderia ubonensis TaxID=101571 RepID=UPI0005D88762|nr:hypothetical protein [Burkholderia ubonensis]AJX17322.1 hypothetical protein BW23_2489 [Burkholderia ubonensis MSMB22]KVR38896.1 hypothetical protein WK18_24380 [Burkholderia ubonensis]KWB51930.1 hypothetical protein WL37_07845 [Burkholderia ubonensis]KWB72549.1 hypothetical protein WL41_20355 [Burkholderia ubonensis]KWC09061.1 hypothetical protein WL46_11665 [Burkholderia ubonensis]